MKNINVYPKNDLLILIKDIDSKIDKKITLIAIGGTALTLLEIKDSTRDIDIIIPSKEDLNALIRVFHDINFKELSHNKWMTEIGIIIDIFEGDYIFNLQLIESPLKASALFLELDNIKLKTLNLYDIIITKTERGDNRDFSDIKMILIKEKLDMDVLVERYMKTTELSAATLVKRKLLDLIDIKFKEWNISIDKKIIEKVQKWEEN